MRAATSSTCSTSSARFMRRSLPSILIRPFSSASGMNTSGDTGPSSRRQRISDYTASISRVTGLQIGW